MRLAHVFTDHMVIQSGKPIYIFGEGRGRGSIELCGERADFVSENESWCVELPAKEYGGPYQLRATLEGEEIVLSDIYVGEVWLAGGQSNMELPLFRTEYGLEEAEHAANGMIRLFTVARRVIKDRAVPGWHFIKTDGEDTPWQVCDEESALRFSAIGYYAAKELQARLGCAVGVISCNWGGVRMESFTGKQWYKDDPTLSSALCEWERLEEGLDKADYAKRVEDAIAEWQEYYATTAHDDIGEVRLKGVRATAGHHIRFPAYPDGPQSPNGFGVLYNSMYSRIIPYGIRGILWYQGESNSRYGYLERYLAFMRCMRDSFRDPTLPIYAIELASYCYWASMKQSTDDRFARYENVAFRREQQQIATEIAPNNYLITSMELGDIYDIHPIQKKLLTHRAVLKILKYTYGFDIAADQPVYRKAHFDGATVTVELDNADGLYIRDGKDDVKIYLADESLQLKRACVEIRDNKLILTSPEVERPILARYAFDNYYNGKHIYNSAGLPLAPFRTDKDQ